VLTPVALGAVVYTGLIWRKAGTVFWPRASGWRRFVAIVTSYYACAYDLLLLIVPLLAMRTRPDDALNADRCHDIGSDRVAASALTPVYWFTRLQFRAESLMHCPLLALAVALARRLSNAGVE